MNKSKIWTLTLALGLAFCLGAMGASSRSVSAAEAATGEKSLQSLPNQSQSSDKPNDTLATEAGSEFSNGGKSLGRGFVKGTRVTGHAFKTAGVTMASGFKKAGRAIHDYFTGKSEPEVQENDLGNVPAHDATQAKSSRDDASQELDAVGNDLPKKSEPDRLVKRAPAGSSKLD